MKRVFDLIASLAALALVSPLFVIVPLLVKLDSDGPAFFRMDRVGMGGKLFKLYKFRTMVVDAQKRSKVVSTPDDDPRITKIGKFLRNLYFDELPQFINVIKGEMSIVGPRPEVQQYVDLLTEEEKIILSVKPGITDWATLWIGDKGKILVGSLDPEKMYLKMIRPTKVRLQIEYVWKKSFWVDIQIVMQTIIFILFRKQPQLSLGGVDLHSGARIRDMQ